jgi:hypothetical protein
VWHPVAMAIQELILQLRDAGEHETYPPASERDVAHTESAIGIALPPSFRTFVTQFSNGAYLFLAQEVSAVGPGNPQITPLQDNAAEGVPADPDAEVPAAVGDPVKGEALVPFSLDSNGNCWCFVADRASADGEYAVAYCDTQGMRLVGHLSSFEEWLGILVREQEEVIRALGLADELDLG